MKTKNVFTNASYDDLEQMADIEKKYFSDYERAFDYNFFAEWYTHNPEMFYVVKNEVEGVIAFTVVVPVDETLHNMLLKGEVSDLFDFSKENVCKEMNSDFFYVADICVNNTKNVLVAARMLIEVCKILYSKAKYVTTSPISKYGLKMCQHLGFEEVAKQNYNGHEYPVYCLSIDKVNSKPEKYSKFIQEERRVK